MITISESAVIRRPVEEVFDAAADPQTQLEWDPGTLRSVEKLTPGPLGQGSRYRGDFKGSGVVEYEYVEFDRMGLSKEAEQAARGDLPAALIRAIALAGDPEAAKQRLQAYRDAGADLPVVYPVPALEPVSSMTGTILALAPHPALEA